MVPSEPGKLAWCYIDPYSLEPPENPVHVQLPNKAILEYSSQVFEHCTIVRSIMRIGPCKQICWWHHPENESFVKRTKGMHRIVKASPETIARHMCDSMTLVDGRQKEIPRHHGKTA